MGDQCHAGGYLGILAQSTGDDNGVKSQGHSQGADRAGSKGFWHGDQNHCPKEKQGEDHQPQDCHQINAFDLQHFLQIKLRDGHTGQQHCHGGHTVAGGGDSRADKLRNGYIQKTQYYSHKGAYEHWIFEIPEPLGKGLLFTAVHQQDRHAPEIDQCPKGKRKDQILQKDIGKQGAHHRVSHKSEIGKAQSVCIDISLVFVLAAKTNTQQRQTNGDYR